MQLCLLKKSLMGNLRTIIITGANTGLGYAFARALAGKKGDWFILLACRSEEKAIAAVNRLKAESGHSHIDHLILDLSSLSMVRSFCETFVRKAYPPLFGIVCNAGISLDDEVHLTRDGIEQTFQVNCLGHFLLISQLLPHMDAMGRILFVSSELHREDGLMKRFRPDYTTAQQLVYPEKTMPSIKNSGSKRYSRTKLALLYYTYELADRLPKNGYPGICVNAFNPGLMPDTGLGGLNKKLIRKFFLKYILPIFVGNAMSNPQRSGEMLADLMVSDQYEGLSGKYFDRSRLVKSSALSRDRNKALELWNLSLKAAGIPESYLAKR